LIDIKKASGGINIKSGFKVNKNNELVYLTVQSLEQTNLVNHCFTTRQGGVSSSYFSTLNSSIFKQDDKKNVFRNLDIVCSAIGIDYKRLVSTYQTHSDEVYVVEENDIGRGISREGEAILADALITNVRRVPMITYYADCVPIYLVDTVNKAVGLVHSGWKGTLQKIVEKTLAKMKENYSTDPANCLAAIGPSLEKDCFEVDYDVAEQFILMFGKDNNSITYKENGKYHIDLWKINTDMLINVGVKEDNITVCELCTKCNEELFFSYRRDKGKTGSLSAIIELK